MVDVWRRNSLRSRRGHGRLAASLIAFAFVVAACGDTPSAGPAESDVVAAADTPDLSSAAHRFEEVVRFGSGRALAAATSGSVTVIGTTIGASVHRGSTVTEIPTRLPTPIVDVTVADDGGTTVLVGATGTGELWDLDSNSLLASYDSAVAVHFSTDGTSVDVVGTRSVVRTSTLDGSTIVDAPRARPGSIASVAWYGPGSRALLVPGDSTSRESEIWTGEAVVGSGYEPGGLSRTVRASGDPGGERAVIGITGGTPDAGALVSLDLTTGQERWRQDIGNEAVLPVWAVGHDGRVLAVVGTEVLLLSAEGTVESSRPIADAVDSVLALAPAPGYAIVGTRGAVEFVDELGRPVGDADSDDRRIVHAAATGDGTIVTDVDGRVRQWDRTGEVTAEIGDHVAPPVNAVAASADGSMVAAATSDGGVAVVGLDASEAVRDLPQRFLNPEGNVDTVAFTPDGTSVVSGVSEANGTNSFDNTLARWDLATGQRRFAVAGDGEPVTGCTEFRNTVRFSPDGRFFVSPFHDYTVSVRDADDGSVVHEFPAHRGVVWDLAVSPDGERLATASDDWTLRIWNLDDHALVSEFDTPPSGFPSIAFTPDGTSMIVSDVSGSLHRLDLTDGTLSAPFEGARDFDARIAVSPDGRYVAAGSADGGTVLIWDGATGRIVQELVGHGATVTGVEFTPDGRGLVTGSEDGTVRYWRVS